MVERAALVELELIFVTGKGGVGKTTVAAALARWFAATGRTVLLCEVDAKGEMAILFESTETGFVPKNVAPNIWAMTMETEASLKEYLHLYLKIPFVGALGPLARALDFVATAAPGVREILTVGKLCYEVKERHYDVVIVDAPSSGHIIGELAAPEAINDLVKVGLIRSQTSWMLDILSDPKRCGVIAVATPEEMPVAETIELAARIKTETKVTLAAVFANRVLPAMFSRREEEVFDAMAQADSLAVIDQTLGRDLGPVFEGAALAAALRRSRAIHLSTLRDGIDPSVPLVLLPYLFEGASGLSGTAELADAIAAELE